jgi:NADH:ubiquinone oxidoreductase subunit 5 (subunit L)/multisubunit Na+/H+ antiporter MnhA subunit
MGGIIKVMPYTGTLFLIGAVAISALPPLNGFASELMLFQAFFQSYLVPSPLVRVLLFAGLSLFGLTSALAAACFVKAFAIIFLAAPRSREAAKAREVSPYMLIGPGVLALLCVLLGVFSFQIFAALGFDSPTPDLAVIGLLLLIFLALTWVVLRLTTTGKTRISETWGCGLVSQNTRMEYTASGFFDPLLTVFKIIYRPEKTAVKNYFDRQSVIFKDGSVEIHTLKLFEKHLYMPVVRFVERLSRFISDRHDVDLDTYILYSFAAVVILILAIGWFV